MAGATGLEPATSGVTGRRSNQLSYAPATVDRGATSYLGARGVKQLPGATPRLQPGLIPLIFPDRREFFPPPRTGLAEILGFREISATRTANYRRPEQEPEQGT